MKKILKASWLGIMISCTIHMIVCLEITLIGNGKVLIAREDALLIFGIGLATGILSVVLRVEKWPNWAKRWSIMLLGCGVLAILLAYWLGKRNVEPNITVVSPDPLPWMIVQVVVILLVLLGFQLYYRREAKKINAKIKEK